MMCNPYQKPHDEKEGWKQQHPETAPVWLKEKRAASKKRKAEEEQGEASKKIKLTRHEMAKVAMAYLRGNPDLCFEEGHP